MAETFDQQAFIHELEPVAENLLNRHLSTTKEWFPHELVPYGLGREFERGYEWHEDDSMLDLPDAVRSALFVNLLTEDNLPYYFRDIERMFGSDGAFGEWNRRWTAEEGRHSIVIRDYLTATRAIDPVALERARMAQVSGGEVPAPFTPLEGIVYVTMQELATRIAHRNTGKMIGDIAGFEIMKQVAADENLHYLFYRDLGSAAIELNPSAMIEAVEPIVETFNMPGTGIIDFDKHAKNIARSGIYNDGIFYEQVLLPVVKTHWNILNLTNLKGEAAAAQDRIGKRIEKIGNALAWLSKKREPKAALVAPA